MPRTTTDIATDINTANQNMATLKGAILACDTTLQNIEDNIDELKRQKRVLEESYSIVSDLRDYLVGNTGATGIIGSLEENCVCIQEIRSDVSVQIFERCKTALSTAENVVIKIGMDIKKAEKDYDSYYSQKTSYEQQFSNCETTLDSLDSEYREAQYAEENVIL